MQQLLELGLRAAVSRSGAAPLLLQLYTSSVPPIAGLLAALPAATLKRLQLSRCDNSKWCTALSQLVNLQEISLRLDGIRYCGPGVKAREACLQALSTVRKLTCLNLHGVAMNDLRMLPVQLKQLCVSYGRQRFLAGQPAAPDMSAALGSQHNRNCGRVCTAAKSAVTAVAYTHAYRSSGRSEQIAASHLHRA